METFVGRNNLVDVLSDTDTLVERWPEYYGPKFDAIKDLRALDDGTLHRGNEFRRVASLVNVPLTLALRMQEPGFFRDRTGFYRWLKDPERGARYMTYDPRGKSRPTVTFTGGDQIAT